MPGMKGISLTPEDWAMVCSRAEDVSTALEAKDTAFVLQLSGE